MAIESKEVIMGVRKATMSSIRIIYRSVCAHPYISAMLFFFLLLSRAFPSLFSFLVSSSPVIVCTAILLGTLLSYGTPNIPHIEEEDKKTQKISSLQTGSVVDNIVVKKDESITVETHLEAVKEEVVGTSNSSSDEIVRDVPSAKMYDEGGGNNYTILSTSAVLHEETKEMDDEIEVMKEREVLDREFSVNNQNELEGFRIQTAKIASGSPFDSSLGSPWQPVNTFDASSGSDSDGAESSSPDASMADIIPMLNELDPLLKSERPHATLSSNDNSDSSSSGSSQDRKLEVENKGDEIKESHAKDESNEVAVAWTENDQNNVMDLGYSEIERNRRLENLIARRRLRKLQRYETEKNLIDLDSLYPTSIPSILAPRRNPFDLPYDPDGNLNLPPIPGSAPSVMQPRRNPFDLPYDEIEAIGNMSREYLNHHDFVSSVQREMLSQRHESLTIEPSLLGDFNQGNEDSKSTEPDIHHGSIMLLSPVSHDVEHFEQDKQSSGATGSIDNDHAVDFNTSASIGETHQGVNSFGVKEEEIGEVGNNLYVSDTQKLESGEDGCEDSSSSSSSEADEKILRVNSYEESANVGETDEKLEGAEEGCEDSSPSSSSKADEISRVNSYEDSANVEETRHVSIQSKQLDNASAADPIYDSNLSVVAITNILSHDEAFIYDATENVISNSLPSVQADFAEGALPQRPFEADIPLEDKDLVGVRSEGEDFSSGMVEIRQSSRDVPPIAALSELETGKIMHSSRLSYLNSESSEDCMIDVDKNVQSEGNEVIDELPSLDESAIHPLPEARIEKSHVNSLDSSSIPKENLEEHQKSVVHPPASSDLTALQVVEESNVHMLDVEQETSICQKAVPEEKNGDALVETSMIQTYDGEFPGSESTESIEFSNISHMKLDHEMGTINDSIDTQRTVTNEILFQNEGEFLKKLSNSGEELELDAEVHPEVSRLTDIDEGLLSELDAVGDFRAEREHISSQEISNQELGQIGSIIEDSCAESQDSKVSSVNYDAIPLGDDPELTLYNSELHALGACSLEECKESAVPHSDLTTENLVPTEPESGPSELGIANKNQEITESDTDLLVLEAKSVEDISAALKQISKGLDNPSISEVETSVALPEITHADAEEINSDLHVVEAKSLEDINLVLKQPSEATLDSHQGERKHENVCTEIEASGKDLETEVLEVQSSEASERNLEPAHVEVKSAEEIKLDSVERSAEKSDGNENAANVSSASTSRKVRKKKSGSSSSDSSSSSSDSE